VYQRIVKVANYFLDNAKGGLSLDDLKDFDPTIEKIAKNMRILAMVVRELAGSSYEDEDTAINAHQCCIVMEQIALAVERENESELPNLVKMLDMHANGAI
jgi:hypothetical protein